MILEKYEIEFKIEFDNKQKWKMKIELKIEYENR